MISYLVKLTSKDAVMIMFNIKSNLTAVRNSEEGTGVTEALHGPRLEKKALPLPCLLYFE